MSAGERSDGTGETFFDVHFFRPVAHLVAGIARPTPIGATAVTAVNAVVGLSGASLLRYPGARQLVPGALLLLMYGVLDATAKELAGEDGTAARANRVLRGAVHYVVGISSAMSVGSHLSAEGGSAALALLGLVSVVLQATLADYFTMRCRERSDLDHVDELVATEAELAGGASAFEETLFQAYTVFLRLERALGAASKRGAPPETKEDARAYATSLAPLAKAWAYLGSSTHLALLAVLVCFGAEGAYVWLRLTLGNVALVALFVLYHQKESALEPPPAVETHDAETPDAAPLPKPESVAPPPAPVETRDKAPISFRPPPMDD